MTGVITSLPPLIEQPPGNSSSNPAGLPGVTYTIALLGLAQTWTAKQTFPLGNISLNAGDIIGLAPSSTIDTTNASNITSGTLAAARLPNPTVSTLGGVESIVAISHNWINSISTSGVPALSQPAFTDISGSVAATQLPNPTATTLGGIESLAAVGSKWINTISTSGVPTATQPAFTDISGNISTGQMNSGTSASSATFWRGDGIWAAISGAVTSIAGNAGAFTLSNGIKNATNDIQADPVFHRSYLAGLTLSTAGASTTFGIAIGLAVDSTNAGFMSLASAYTKTTGAWAVGTGNGAIDTGSIAATTFYHVFLIKRTDTGVVDVVFSATATPAAGPTTMPTSYTLFRRIGTMRTNGSSQWVFFHQLGDEFLWDVSVVDVNGVTIGTTALTPTLTIPTGVQVGALMSVAIANTVAASLLVNSPDQSSQVATTQNSSVRNITATNITTPTMIPAVRSNTSGQIRAVADTASSTYSIVTHGWIDTRGRFN